MTEYEDMYTFIKDGKFKTKKSNRKVYYVYDLYMNYAKIMTRKQFLLWYNHEIDKGYILGNKYIFKGVSE